MELHVKINPQNLGTGRKSLVAKIKEFEKENNLKSDELHLYFDVQNAKKLWENTRDIWEDFGKPKWLKFYADHSGFGTFNNCKNTHACTILNSDEFTIP